MIKEMLQTFNHPIVQQFFNELNNCDKNIDFDLIG